MPKKNKRKSQSHEASESAKKVHKRAHIKEDKWVKELTQFDLASHPLYNPKGRTRSPEEIKLVLLALKSRLTAYVASRQTKYLSWSVLEDQIAYDFCIDSKMVKKARLSLLDDGTVPKSPDSSNHGRGSDKYEKSICD